MFFNDLHLFIEHCDSDYYADDATVHTHGNIQTEIEAKLQHDGKNTKLWYKQNKMEINYDKTILCTISLAISYASHLFCTHLCAVPINFNCNDENRILGE